MVHPHVVDGQTLFLVQPQHIGAKFTQANKHFRSSVWDSDGNLVSAGFPKFVNWGENPENFPVPKSLKDTQVVEKIDGSLLIVSKWRGNYILRTRGTVDAHALDNGHELAIFERDILPKLPFDSGSTWEVSVLFEWVSPNQRIILNYGDQPEWYLVGVVGHTSYQLVEQETLDYYAKTFNFKRPPSYTFPTVEDLMKGVEQWKGKEGVVVYAPDGQNMWKIKALEYLTKHRFKSEATLENTLELYFSVGTPSYQEFERRLIEAFDYECFEMVRGFASSICDAHKDVQKIVAGMQKFVDEKLKPLPTRRDQAQLVLSSYAASNRSAMVFSLLDGKTLTNDQLKKLFWQVLKK